MICKAFSCRRRVGSELVTRVPVEMCFYFWCQGLTMSGSPTDLKEGWVGEPDLVWPSFPISTLALKKPCWTDLYESHLRHNKYVKHFRSFSPDRSVTKQWQWPCDAVHYEDWHFPEAGFLKKVSLSKAITTPCHPPDNMMWRYEDWHFPAKFSHQTFLGCHVGLLTHLMIEIST